MLLVVVQGSGGVVQNAAKGLGLELGLWRHLAGKVHDVLGFGKAVVGNEAGSVLKLFLLWGGVVDVVEEGIEMTDQRYRLVTARVF